MRLTKIYKAQESLLNRLNKDHLLSSIKGSMRKCRDSLNREVSNDLEI